jgi:flagellin-like protein
MGRMDAGKGVAGVIAVIIFILVTIWSCYGIYVITGGGAV